MATAHEPGQFDRVVEMNESAKRMLALSFEVSRRALDAMVRSRQAGNTLSGFGEVSSQMRSWARDLHQQLEVLNKISLEAVEATSALVKRGRMAALIEGAARAATTKGAIEAVAETARRALADGRQQVERVWGRVASCVEDLTQLGMMACVLSRSAMIEASYGSGAEQEVLSQMARDFARNADQVVAINGLLTRQMRGMRP